MMTRVFPAISVIAALVAIVLSRFRGIPPHFTPPIDMEVYAQGGLLFLRGLPLYEFAVPTSEFNLPFTYPPFAALLFSTFAWLPMPAIVVGYHLVTVAFALLIGKWLKVHPLVMVGLLLATQPGFATLSFGQINIFLITLVLADTLDQRPSWLPRGTLIGIAAAIKVTPAIFILLFFVRRDVRGMLGVIAGGGAATLLAALFRPRDTWVYFTDALPNANRVGDPSYIHNASITGVLSRLDLEMIAKPVTLIVVLLGMWAAYQASRAEEDLVAICAIAATGLLFSPISWTHHFVWLPIIGLVSLRLGLHKAFAWWVGIAITIGMSLTSLPGWIAAVGAAQYALILLTFLVAVPVLCGRIVAAQPGRPVL